MWINRQSGATYPTATAPSYANSVTGVDAPQITVWPTPDGSQSYQFVYWRLRRLQEAGNGVNGQDIPFRFLTAMVAGLAYRLSMKLPNMDPTRIAALKAEYEQQWQLASEEDREKANIRFVPRSVSYFR